MSLETDNLKTKTTTEPQSSKPLDETPSVRDIVERYLPEVEWKDPLVGTALCPGHHLHSHQPAKRDAKIYINGVPTLYCFHDKCSTEVEAVNAKIRAAWSLFQPDLSPEALLAAQIKAAHKHALESRAKVGKDQILKEFAWDLTGETEFDKMNFSGHFVTWLGLWKPDDIIWIGEPGDSGQIKHQEHFFPVHAIGRHNRTGRYSCASTFKPGSYSRRNLDVLTTPYLIVEGDAVLGKVPETDDERKENKRACGAIFNWLRSKCGLSLRAVVDSGNKSLHGWFSMPGNEVYEELRVILPALGCDRAMFKPSQPARIPGVIRENGNKQKLLYFK